MKALVVCTGGGIGDVLLATPCMRSLRSRYDEVVALTSRAHADVLAGNPDLAAVLVDDVSFATMRGRLAEERFDAAVVTWATLRTAALPFLARIPVRVGQARRLYSAMFTKRVTVRSELGDETSHWTHILLDYAYALGCDTADSRPTFVLSQDAATAARMLRRDAGICGPYAVLHPTRAISGRHKRWPTAPFAALSRALQAAFGVPVVVTGTDGDRVLADAIASGGGAVSVAGRTSIAQFGALARDALFVVAMDSGPMHVAAAVGAPTVGIFALASDRPQRWAPLGERVAVVRGTYPCPPSHRKETCPDFACVRDLPIGAVIEAVRGVTAGPSAAPVVCARG